MNGSTPARRSVVSHWSTDKDFLGAYSFLRPGGSPADRDALCAEIIPGLYLAGEYTWSASPGTMHGAVLSGMRAGRLLLERTGDPPTAPVVVIGAGLSGLAAARLLVSAGRTVHILEAGERTGGRAVSDSSLGFPLPLGGAWLHGTVGHPLAEHVGAVPWTWDRSATYVIGHGAVSMERVSRLNEQMQALERRLDGTTPLDAATDVSLAVALQHGRTAVVSNDAVDHAVLDCWLRFEYECFVAAPFDQLSTRHRLEPYHLAGGEHQITSGLDTAISDLAAGLDIRLKGRVVSLTRRPDERWAVACEDGYSIEASAVICATPVHALRDQHIGVQPALAAEARDALNKIGSGSVAKVFFTFDDVFWAPHTNFLVTDSEPPPFELFVDMSALAGQPVLCAFAVGKHALVLETMDERERCAVVDCILTAVWPPATLPHR